MTQGQQGHMGGAAASLTPEQVVTQTDARIDAMFRAQSGKPLVRAKKQPPLGPGRGNYVRAYSYSMMGFAARCLYLNEMIDEANAAIVENARHYLDNPKDINDRDSFHWHAEIVLRLIEMYGTHGTMHAGRITPETESLAFKPIWEYVRKVSWLDKAEFKTSQTWHLYQSENHHAMMMTVCWHFSKLAKDQPEYALRKYNDGATAAEHYAAWNAYFIEYCRERARKGICVEMMCGDYNSTLIKGYYNFHDFGDPQVKRMAGLLLDLYFAYWAQEQIDGVQGGGRSRVYYAQGLREDRAHGMGPLAWFYFGIGELPAVYGHDMNAALSDYRPPAVVADIAQDVAGRGRYEVRQRAQGLGTQGRPLTTAVTTEPSKLRTDGGGILRYTYCDPAFIMGTPMCEARPLSDWAAISSQNRWQGVIFAGDPGARIVVLPRPADRRVAFNGFWSVQSKGCLITQKLKTHKGAAEMIVWMSEAGLSAPVEEDGLVFIEAPEAYAAVRVVSGGYAWDTPEVEPNSKFPDNATMVLKNEYAPVIVEVMAKNDVTSFDDFKANVKACAVAMDGPVLRYVSIYGDTLTLDTSYRATPTINGDAVDYVPPRVYDSPFIVADYNSGIVTLRKGERVKVLDFTVSADTPHEAGSATPSMMNDNDQSAFDAAAAGRWMETLSYSGQGDWREKWFLDGEVGRVSNGFDGMTLTAGPEAGDDAHHMVLWTKQSFEGDVKIEYEYTRLDDANRFVNILYIQATGSGQPPYDKDILAWQDLRRVPAMRTYFNNMHTYHLSYAAFDNAGTSDEQYLRARRYMPHGTGLAGSDLRPDYFPKGLFAPGVTHRITVIKQARDIFVRIDNPDQVFYAHMANIDLPPITEGRIGLRHMYTRSARYRDFRVYVRGR